MSSVGSSASNLILSLVIDAFRFLAREFIKRDPLAAKVEYVDTWPATCQKAEEIAVTFWNRRKEAAITTAITGTALAGSYFLSSKLPKCGVLFELASKATTSFLGLFSLNWGQKGTPAIIPSILVPMAVGGAANFLLGTTDLYNLHIKKEPFVEIQPIFNDAIQESIEDYRAAIQDSKNTKAFLPNLIFHGPPGTGKTMISKWLAKHSGMNYVLLSGSKLVEKLGSGNVEALEKLLDHAANLTTPTVIFIDEGDAFFTKRGQVQKNKGLATLQETLLTRMSSASQKLMFIFATNVDPKDLPEALIDRVEPPLFIGLPELAARKRIIETTIPVLWPDAQKRPKFTEQIIDHIAQQTDNVSGRGIFQLLNRLKLKVIQGKPLTTQSVDLVIKTILQKKEKH